MHAAGSVNMYMVFASDKACMAMFRQTGKIGKTTHAIYLNVIASILGKRSSCLSAVARSVSQRFKWCNRSSWSPFCPCITSRLDYESRIHTSLLLKGWGVRRGG